MAPHPSKLTIVPFLQTWDPAAQEITLNIMVTPVGDPRVRLTDGWPGALPASPSQQPFQGSSIVLEAHLSNDPGRVPNRADVPGSGSTFPLTMPGDQASIFQELPNQFDLSEAPTVVEQQAGQSLLRYLPRSYRRSFAFVAPKTPLAVLDDRYHCALRCPPDGRPPHPTPSKKVSWGDAFGSLLRIPALSRAAGLVHTVTISVGNTFANGGWIFFTLAGTSDFRAEFDADADFARFFATRVPALSTAATRPVFTAVLFPVAADAAGTAAFGSLDGVFGEASRFDDGFAKIVHARQPLKEDLSADDDDEKDIAPLKDAGIQLGWDDEDLVESLNRVIGLYPDGSKPAVAPPGVAGYRVDVRKQGDTDWSSLCKIISPAFRLGLIDIAGFQSELNVEVAPSKIDGQFWLPAYNARWQGFSMVADTPDRRMLLNRFDDTPDRFSPLDANAVPLKYGERYEFRVRLADTTGGGPSWDEGPVNAGEAPVASWHFRRAIAPKTVSVEPVAPAAGSPPTTFWVSRPGIAFPEAEFAGAPNAEARLAAIVRANIARQAANLPSEPDTIPDPDTVFAQLKIMVRPPNFDPLADVDGWQELYTTYRSFPTMAADGSAARLKVELNWVDCAHLSDITWEVPTQPAGTVTGTIPVPTARDVRIVVTAVGRNDLNYWMNNAVRFGQGVDLTQNAFHVPASAEPSIFQGNDPATAISSVFMQPDPPSSAPTLAAVLQRLAGPVLPKRLATAVSLVEEDSTIFGPPGERMVFGCAGLKHHLPPDFSSLALTAIGELPQQWINVVRLVIDRDWTWLGLATPAFSIRRILTLVPEGTTSTRSLGTVSVQHAVNIQATRGTPNREKTELVFVDAFVPPLKNGLPFELEVTYEIEASLENGETHAFSVKNRLPVTTPPKQLPKVASVGHAFSEYTIDGPDYANTGVRQRMLWVEFAERPLDDRDVYFARVLTSAPDPMLLSATEPVSDPPGYDDPPLDPEMVRVIAPGQADDFAGLSALQRLIPAAEDPTGRFFLVPLPPNMSIDSKDLFGFFTYEFRVGHDRGTPTKPFWSTAQGRFGPGLVIEGVQHPAPVLTCSVFRSDAAVEVFATYAEAVHNGRDMTPAFPNTEIWATLYARVMQADGSTRRPIQLDARRAKVQRNDDRPSAAPTRGQAEWDLAEIHDLLKAWGLPEDTPLSALAIELLPEPNGRFADPLGGDLSQVRILRSSPLTEVDGDCCH